MNQEPMTDQREKDVPEQFKEWFRKNYPGPNTIIYKPDFHSPSIYRAAIAAMGEAQVVVNELVWVEECDFHCSELFECYTSFGRYSAFKDYHRPKYSFCLEDGPEGPEEHKFDTIEEAKAAAQADFERRILSNLTTAPKAPEISNLSVFQMRESKNSIATDGPLPSITPSWQPIETAPENTTILIWVPGYEHYGFAPLRAILVNMGTGKRWHTTAYACGRDLGPSLSPTHWMHLPEPPAQQEEAREGV